ncbi:MAG: ArsR family transcriptional regulator, partial [Anaerolineae bacterium]|nr:ArsR family transcriptional regulator [Anaerolineae bacterium]
MQPTRQRILAVLRERGTASVDELAEILGVTPMAIRHHLHVLVGESLVVPAHVERRGRPGRPRQMYALAPEAGGRFPDGFRSLSSLLLAELQEVLAPEAWDALLARLATRLIPPDALPTDDAPLGERLGRAARYLQGLGVSLHWQADLSGGWALRAQCPFGAEEGQERWACDLHRAMLLRLLRVPPERLARAAAARGGCVYRLAPED